MFVFAFVVVQVAMFIHTRADFAAHKGGIVFVFASVDVQVSLLINSTADFAAHRIPTHAYSSKMF